MGFGDLGSSTSTSQYRSADLTASEQAIILNKSQNDPIRITLGKGAVWSPTITQGISEERFAELGAQITAGLAGVGSAPDTTGTDVESAVEKALAKRTAEQITEAPKEANTFGTSNWILVAVGALMLFGAAAFKRKHG